MANLKREWVHNGNSTDCTTGDFVVLTYNILNKAFCPEGVYPYCPDDLLTTERRHPLLMKEVDHHKDADIICMQEVNQQYYDDVLFPDMQMRGFQGDYVMRPLSKTTVADRENMDGSATFYRGTRFQLVKQEAGHFNQLFEKEREKCTCPDAKSELPQLTNSDRSYLFSLLRCLKTNRHVSVGNVHLTFNFYTQMDLTALETAVAIDNLVLFAGADVPHILCGDFNQEPHHPGYQLLHDGKLNETMTTYLRTFNTRGNEGQVISLVDVLPDCYEHSSVSLKSAYETVVGHEVPFTCYEDSSAFIQRPKKVQRSEVVKALFDGAPGDPKVRKTDPEAIGSELFAGALDYIWFSSNSLHCDGVLKMVDEELILPFHGCPNAVFPSDHMPVKAMFSFLDASRNPIERNQLHSSCVDATWSGRTGQDKDT